VEKSTAGAKEGVDEPAGVVFSSTDTVLLNWLATTRSGLPSPLKSPIATEVGSVPAEKLTAGAKEGVEDPGGVVFSRTDTVLLPALATARSGRPSPFRSPTATEMGSAPVEGLIVGAKVGSAPATLTTPVSWTENVRLALETPFP
jgi:hypothetical protein